MYCMIFISKVLIDLDLTFVTLADSILVDCMLVGFVVLDCELIFSGALAVASYTAALRACHYRLGLVLLLPAAPELSSASSTFYTNVSD